jgi:hypothetical protein
MTDFCVLYQDYIDKVDNVIFPSKFFAEYYKEPQLYMDGRKMGNTVSDKNLYLGSPKYDLELDAQSIKKKYGLSDNKKALVVFPKLEFVHSSDVSKIYSFLKKMNYEIIVKARGKDHVPTNLMGDKCFLDFSWYPHSTIELINVCDFIVNFGSTVVKECIMDHTPLVNFEIKPYKHLSFLFDGKYCKELTLDIDYDIFKQSVADVLKCDNSEYKNCINKYLFDKNQVSFRILNHLGVT